MPLTDSAMPHIWAIVLCHNQVNLTLGCLASLRGQSYPHLSVLVVDNASTDDTVERVHRDFPEVEVLSTGRNLGYAGGNNAGMRHALAFGADALFLLNNDTLLAPDCVARLADRLSATPDAGAIGPMIYTWQSDSQISSAGGAVDWAQADAVNVGAGEEDYGQYPARSVDFLNGCALLLPRAAVERVGMLDEAYFMYWEETDWCLRLRRAGYSLWFEPAARLQHKAPIRHATMGVQSLYYTGRNRLRFFALHTPPAQRPRVLARAVWGLLRGIVANRRRGRPDIARAGLRALTDALLGRWGRRTITFPSELQTVSRAHPAAHA